MKAFNKKRKPKNFTKTNIKFGKIAKIIINYYRPLFPEIEIVNNLKETDLFIKGIYLFFYSNKGESPKLSYFIMNWRKLYIHGNDLPKNILQKINKV